ncbi:MAG: hypothetical protein IT206_05260 [Fimbriimonadaceae bacterium]|nr:hypothetical protein [Fimbriimonadaceae bacterium]
MKTELTAITRKALVCLLVSLFASLGIHPCTATYVLPSGSACAACPELSKECESPSMATDDCRSCCELVACHDESELASQFTATPIHYDLDLPVLHPLFLETSQILGNPPIIWLAGSPPVGPPDHAQSRAPPLFLMA